MGKTVKILIIVGLVAGAGGFIYWYYRRDKKRLNNLKARIQSQPAKQMAQKPSVKPLVMTAIAQVSKNKLSK